MTFKKPLLFLSVLLVFAIPSAYAQPRKNDNPLFRFFQANFDSTIIHHTWSTWYIYPSYWIVAKKDSSIYFFTYNSPYSRTRGRYFPRVLLEKFMNEQLLFQQTQPDTNRYFLPVINYSIDRKKAWAAITACNIWQAEEVPNGKTNCDVYDGSNDTFYLIVKDSMKVLNYYEAEYFEKCGPANIHRQNAIRTVKEFIKIFK